MIWMIHVSDRVGTVVPEEHSALLKCNLNFRIRNISLMDTVSTLARRLCETLQLN